MEKLYTVRFRGEATLRTMSEDRAERERNRVGPEATVDWEWFNESEYS